MVGRDVGEMFAHANRRSGAGRGRSWGRRVDVRRRIGRRVQADAVFGPLVRPR